MKQPLQNYCGIHFAMSNDGFGDPLGKPPIKCKMSLDDALAELGYGNDDWPSVIDVNKRSSAFLWKCLILSLSHADIKNCN